MGGAAKTPGRPTPRQQRAPRLAGPSLRERQTLKRRHAILGAAAHLFTEQGYAATNVEDIAARAEVAVSTIYKYFGAKGGLIRELWRPEIERMRESGERLIAAPPADPPRALADLISLYRFGEDWKQRDLFRAVAGYDLGYGDIFQGLRERLDEVILSQLQGLITAYQRQGRIPARLKPVDMAMVLYSIMNLHLQLWAMRSDVSLDRTRRDMRRRIALAFESWINPD